MITIFLFALSGFFKAINNAIKDHYDNSIFSLIKNKKIIQWIDPRISWENKYKWGKGKKIPTFLFKTIFVWITDLWHFCEMLNRFWYAIATVKFVSILPFCDALYVFILVACCFVPFHVFYTWIFSLEFWNQFKK